MDDSRLVARLASLGLTGYEAKAYTALIRRDSYTAAQLARQAGLPRQRIYDVLGSLVERGLAAARPGRVAHYVAMPPDVAIETLLAARREDLVRLEADARELAGDLRLAYDAGQAQAEPLEYVEIMRDRHIVTARTAALCSEARAEILKFDKSSEEASLQLPRRLAGSRAPARLSVYEYAALDVPAIGSALERRAGAGEQQRFVASLPVPMTVIDSKTVVLGLEDSTIIATDPSLAAILKAAFDAIWKSGLALDEARKSHETGK